MAKRTDNENLITNPDILYKYSVDAIVVMTALLLAGIYLNGLNALRTTFFAVLTSIICEDIACRITKRIDRDSQVLYACATGLAIALMLPAVIPAYAVVAASAFAVIGVLIPFGSARKVPFVPAAAGLCFATLCFPKAVFTYAPINILTSSPLYGTEEFISGESFSSMLTYGKSVILNLLETTSLLMGKAPGPMGTTCILVLLGAAIYMLIKHKENFIISVSFLVVCAVYAVLFPRVSSGTLTSVILELSSGMLLFAAILLLPDPFTAPVKLSGKIAYGFFAGIICMLLRRYGAYEESVCFTVLIMNALAPAVGDYVEIWTNSLKEKGVIKEKLPVFRDLKVERPKKDERKKSRDIEKKEKDPGHNKIKDDKKNKKEKETSKKREKNLKEPKDKKDKAQNKEKRIKDKAEKQRKRSEEKKEKIKKDPPKRYSPKGSKEIAIDHLSYEALMNFDDTSENITKKDGEN